LRPAWSADGRTFVVSEPRNTPFPSPEASFDLISPDGSCLDCQTGFRATDAAFTSNPTLFTALVPIVQPFLKPPLVVRPELVELGVDGLVRKVLLSTAGALSDPVWSSRGELAVVRGGWIWVGRLGKLEPLTNGTAPSWSPDGTRIVFDRRGWLMIGGVRGSSFRRLVRGTAPAWSPDGRSVAFFAHGHRLSVVAAGGGRVRRVGAITGITVDWQPLPTKPPAACQLPPGSTVIASSDGATVSLASGSAPPVYGMGLAGTWASMGCLRNDGRERLLRSEAPGGGGTSTVQAAAVAGNYAALAVEYIDGKYQQQGGNVELFDLRTGCTLQDNPECDASVQNRGGESTGCPLGTGITCVVDGLVLGSDAVSAVHETARGQNLNGTPCSCTVERIQASDSISVRTLDSITEPDGSPPALTDLTLTGDTLAWQLNGSLRSAPLQP
jgi:hypothetical protein